MSDLALLDRRPEPGAPRAYDFPDFERSSLPNGLEVIRAHVPGRPLLQAQLLVRGDSGGGASSEGADLAGVTVLTARAMSEGTERRDAVALVEAAERLGASLGATAGWDNLGVQVEVPRARLAPALALLAEMALEPSFPAREVERLREERLNDLKQTMADPRRRVERLFPSVIYAEGATYARLLGGSEDTVAALDRADLEARHADQMRPSASTLIVCGDLEGVPVDDIVAEIFLGWASEGASVNGATAASPATARWATARLATARPATARLANAPSGIARPAAAPSASAPDLAAPGRRVVLVDRPGAPQSEVRVGHVGSPRRIDDYHALVVMNALLGGLFNSRLNRLLREERGYTYGVHADLDMRRGAGPFAVRCAVETEATAPAIADIVAELSRIREAEVEADELLAARDYLVGVFPLRFESSAQVAGALAGLIIHGLPDDELDRYRPTVAAVSAGAVLQAARSHVDPDRASIVVVGDVSRFETSLRDAGYADVEVIHDEGFGDGDPA